MFLRLLRFFSRREMLATSSKILGVNGDAPDSGSGKFKPHGSR
jgi:hypothetical protein